MTEEFKKARDEATPYEPIMDYEKYEAWPEGANWAYNYLEKEMEEIAAESASKDVIIDRLKEALEEVKQYICVQHDVNGFKEVYELPTKLIAEQALADVKEMEGEK